MVFAIGFGEGVLECSAKREQKGIRTNCVTSVDVGLVCQSIRFLYHDWKHSPCGWGDYKGGCMDPWSTGRAFGAETLLLILRVR